MANHYIFCWLLVVKCAFVSGRAPPSACMPAFHDPQLLTIKVVRAKGCGQCLHSAVSGSAYAGSVLHPRTG